MCYRICVCRARRTTIFKQESNNYFYNETMGANGKAIIPDDLRPYSAIANMVLSAMLLPQTLRLHGTCSHSTCSFTSLKLALSC